MPIHSSKFILVLIGGCLCLASCGGGRSDSSGSTPSGPGTTSLPSPPPSTAVNSPASVVTVRVVASFPHHTGSFTEGLAYYNGTLYESTGGYGSSSLQQVTINNGDVVQNINLTGEFFGEGITVLDNRIYQLTLWERTGFAYDPANLQETGRFSYSGAGWGITTDGTSLITSNGSDTLTFLDPGSFSVTRAIHVNDGGKPVTFLNELEWVRGEIWANVWQSFRIARIDPQDGHVKEWIDLSSIAPPISRQNGEAVLNGIAYDPDNDRLFVTGKLWPTLFQIAIP